MARGGKFGVARGMRHSHSSSLELICAPPDNADRYDDAMLPACQWHKTDTYLRRSSTKPGPDATAMAQSEYEAWKEMDGGSRARQIASSGAIAVGKSSVRGARRRE